MINDSSEKGKNRILISKLILYKYEKDVYDLINCFFEAINLFK